MTTLVALTTILTSSCVTTGSNPNPNAPSELGALLAGTWVSATALGGGGLPEASDCTELEWTFNQTGPSTYDGTFRATCHDGVELEGTATGVLIDDALTIEATGTATLPGATGCAFTLTGDARMEGDAIRVDYSGSTCLGPVSGSQLLERS